MVPYHADQHSQMALTVVRNDDFADQDLQDIPSPPQVVSEGLM